MKVFKIYYEDETGVKIVTSIAKSRRSLIVPDGTIKVSDITEDFKRYLKDDIEAINDNALTSNIVLILEAVGLF